MISDIFKWIKLYKMYTKIKIIAAIIYDFKPLLDKSNDIFIIDGIRHENVEELSLLDESVDLIISDLIFL